MSTQSGTWAAASSVSGTGSTNPWNNPNYTQTQGDGLYSTCGLNAHTGVSYVLGVTFTFTGANAIPLGSTINGFTVAVWESANNASAVFDDGIILAIPTVAAGSDLSGGSAWAITQTDVSYGGPTNLCG